MQLNSMKWYQSFVFLFKWRSLCTIGNTNTQNDCKRYKFIHCPRHFHLVSDINRWFPWKRYAFIVPALRLISKETDLLWPQTPFRKPSSSRSLGACGLHYSLDVNLWHARASSSKIRRPSTRVLGIVIWYSGFDGIFGEHRAMDFEIISHLKVLWIQKDNYSRFTGGRHNSFAISVLRIRPASSKVIPRTSSVKYEDEAIAEPQPNVLNLTSEIVLLFGSTRICSFITSPQAGAPTRPVPTSVSAFGILPTLRGRE